MLHVSELPHTEWDLDIACIGFGPAGIALACAIDECEELSEICSSGRVKFFEKNSSTAWHGNFILPGTDINHHLFRDLVTPRNPQSAYSFAMYLKNKNRLFKFGLLGRPASRAEWSDYIKWVAGQLEGFVEYNSPINEILPVVSSGVLTGFRIKTPEKEYTTKHLVLSSGNTPNIPDVFKNVMGGNVFHTSSYLQHMTQGEGPVPHHWLVIGSGQSAGEAVSHLLSRSPDIQVHSVHRSVGFRIGQLGQFPNLAFLPEQARYFYHLNEQTREQVLSDVRAVNYAGVDADESQALYSHLYEGEVSGQQRLVLHTYSEIINIEKMGVGYSVSIQDINTKEREDIYIDGIVLGTGYIQETLPSSLIMLIPWLERNSEGGIVVSQKYQINIKSEKGVCLLANGISEKTHGISDSQSFSMVAVRAEILLEQILTELRNEKSFTHVALTA